MKMFKRNYNYLKSIDRKKIEKYSEYIDSQNRCDPEEFLKPRIKILSSVLFLCNTLQKLGISKPIHSEVYKKKELISDRFFRGDSIKILDVGARDGWTVELLNSLGYSDVTGIELIQEYVEYAIKQNRNVKIGDIHQIPFEANVFDVIFSRHVLEHSLDPEVAINEMFRVLKPQGVAYISFPLEKKAHTKHPIAIPSLKIAKKLFKAALGDNFNALFFNKAEKTEIVLPDHDEVVVILQKALNSSK